jgi:type IV pilus assembly protein PilN
MRINLNLASDPFRRDRPFIVAAWALGSILSLMLVALTFLALATRDDASEARVEVEKARAELAKAQAERARLETELRRPDNGEVIERSVFLNQLLTRKGISWTRIFSSLEQVLPYNVRLVNVRPQVTSENLVQLDMVVGCQAPEPVIEMLMKMEASPSFGATQVTSILPPSSTEPLYRYRVTVNYTQRL